ncbi:MAG: hypothetical protein HY698_18030 [Deltaproteobacteria bacterium]|nr:hypothetical protein [Deltaproteobacteria bacterium]
MVRETIRGCALGVGFLFVLACSGSELSPSDVETSLTVSTDSLAIAEFDISDHPSIASDVRAVGTWSNAQPLPRRCGDHEVLLSLSLKEAGGSETEISTCTTERKVDEYIAWIERSLARPADGIGEVSQAVYGHEAGCRAGSSYSCCRLGGGSHMLCNFWFGY